MFQSIIKLWRALGYAWQGLRIACSEELAFRVELAVSIPLILLTFFLDISSVERAMLIGSCLLVLMTELINSAFEAVVDRISIEQHPLSAKAKDLAAAALLLSLIIALVLWTLVLWEVLFGT